MSKTITRNDLTASIYSQIGLSAAESNRIITVVFDEIKNALDKEACLKIANFGSFYVKEKNARIGRNPKTLEEFKISARRVVSFYPASSLKFRINK
jgi:integration host factor subunit alpha